VVHNFYRSEGDRNIEQEKTIYVLLYLYKAILLTYLEVQGRYSVRQINMYPATGNLIGKINMTVKL
jgi:hypothetical protein